MSSPRFTGFAWGVFAYSLLVIMWGYFLRISESGDGCGTDWPLCQGTVVPAGAEFPTWVEFTHRISSGLVLILVLLLLVWALRRFPRGHAVRKVSGLALLFTFTESLFGAMLVVFGWVATDISLARILLRPFHVTNTFLLMAALVLVPVVAGSGMARLPRLKGASLRLFAPALLGVLVLGWTGSWTGLAATAFPAGTVAEGMGQYLDPEHLLIYLRVTHPVLALVVVALLVKTGLGMRRREGPGPVQALGPAVAALAVVQLGVGVLTVLLLNPIWSRLLHLLLADLLWVAFVAAGALALAYQQDLLPDATPGRTRLRSPAGEGRQPAGAPLDPGR
jgi:heme a synthase